MLSPSLKEMIKGRVREFIREPSALPFVVIMPIIWMVILGYAYTDPMEDGTRYIDFLIPGLLALSIMTTSLYGTGMTIVVNRRENLLKRYLVTPMNPYYFFISHILGRLLILSVEFLTIFIAGKILFQFDIAGNFLAYLLIAILGTGAFTALALFFGSRLKNTGGYNGMINLVVLPMMLLSGIWFPREKLPAWILTITDYLPLTALVESLRSIAIQGESFLITSNIFYLCILGGHTIASAAIAKKIFKWF